MKTHNYRKQTPSQDESNARILLYVGLMVLWMLLLTLAPAEADVVVSERQVHDAVASFVRDQAMSFDGDLEVDVRWRGDIQIPGTGAVDVQVTPSSARGNARLMPVTLELLRGPAVVRELALTAQVTYFADVLVAARPINRGESLTDGAVAVERRDVTRLLGRYLSDPAELDGMQARTRIAFGRPIQSRYVEPTPLVTRGDQVRVRVHIGNVTATSTGVAKEDGAAGETIMVQTPEDRRKLMVRVIAPGLVDLIY